MDAEGLSSIMPQQIVEKEKAAEFFLPQLGACREKLFC
jgi:hypothetical protein